MAMEIPHDPWMLQGGSLQALAGGVLRLTQSSGRRGARSETGVPHRFSVPRGCGKFML